MTGWTTGRTGQALAFGMTALMAFAIWIGLVAPMLAWHAETSEFLAERQTLAAHMEALAASLPALRRQARQGVVAAPVAAPLEGASDELAGAALQEVLRTLAGQAGATLSSVETLPPVPAGVWHRIGLRVSLTAPWQVVVRLLAAVRQGSPRMLVDDLHVHKVGGPQQSEPTPLLTSFVVSGFRASGEKQ